MLNSLETWESFFKSLQKFSDDFMEERLQPEQQVREEIFEDDELV